MDSILSLQLFTPDHQVVDGCRSKHSCVSTVSSTINPTEPTTPTTSG